MTADILHAFAEQLQAAGLLVENVEADGALHRCPVEGKPHGRDGAYKAFSDVPATIWWMNWRTGDEGTWTAKAERDMTAAQRKALRERIRATREVAQAEQARRWTAAAKVAASVWSRAKPADAGHPYL